MPVRLDCCGGCWESRRFVKGLALASVATLKPECYRARALHRGDCRVPERIEWRWAVVLPGVLGCLLFQLPSPATAAQPAGVQSAESEDDEPLKGLRRVLKHGAVETHQIDARPILDQPLPLSGAAADSAEQPMQVRWEGLLLIRESGQYRWHAAVAGGVTVRVGETEVLQTAGADRRFVSGTAVPLSPGDHPLTIDYVAAAGSTSAELHLFWSSDQFTLEPLPADILSHVSADREQLRRQENGKTLADAWRCAACHRQSQPLALLAAPDLDRVTDGQTRQVLLQRLMHPRHVTLNSRMPEFGLTEAEAASVAAWLQSVARKPHAEPDGRFQDNDAASGTILLRSLGCAACHELPGSSLEELAEFQNGLQGNPYAGPSLQRVATRRSAAWLLRWLKQPETLNASHRMPVFELSDDERRQLVAALVADGGSADPGPPDERGTGDVRGQETDEQLRAGRQLVIESNCAACHRIPGLEASPATVSALASTTVAGSPQGCLRNGSGADAAAGPSQSRGGQRIPRFALTDAERSALTEWIISGSPTLTEGAFDQGRRLLARHSCTACHDRDQSLGLSAAAGILERSHDGLRGKSQSLIPPSLTAVGDKLRDDVLQKAISGQQPKRRLPWLMVRMPRFRHAESDAASLWQHLVSADRIPDSADSVRAEIALAARPAVASPADLLTGNQLTGAAGFNCVACHSAGAFEPRNVALGTRGSDLLTMGARLRPSFFQRWMKNPIRVVAGIEMPAIRRAAPGILNESLSEQMAVIWRAISDSRFTAPTVVSRYEQFVTLSPGQRPAIIRDVFTTGEGKNRNGVARALAVGFENGHNLLLDLDSMQLRQWTVGEFARQRTEGKSWFWDTAGVPVATGAIASPAESILFHLLSSDTAATGIPAVIDEARSTELVRYQSDDRAVEVWYRVCFPAGSSARASGRTPNAGAADGIAGPHSAVTAWNNPTLPVQTVLLHERLEPVDADGRTGWRRTVKLSDASAGVQLQMRLPPMQVVEEFGVRQTVQQGTTAPHEVAKQGETLVLKGDEPVTWTWTSAARIPAVSRPVIPGIVTSSEAVTSTPGFHGQRLPLEASIMPTAITWLPDGRMAFTSLRGHVWIAEDTDGDGIEDRQSLFEEGLAAPFGILADGDSILVAHKPEVLRLRDTDGDGRADHREVVAAGWGLTDDYHDWTSGLIRDAQQNLFVGLGSDYSQKDRPQDRDRWRGTVLKIDPSGVPSPVAFAFRYPMSLAIDGQGRMFATDNQGVQNTFNEINHIVNGQYYGVPSRHDAADGIRQESPALQVPHPWTRSVNSILFFPENFAASEFAGHGLGCEYDLRYLVRFTVQEVDGVVQGAVYPFSRPGQQAGGSNFIGPICSAVRPDGTLYIGSIWDSGWQGGPNTGGIARLTPAVERPNGIREVQATAEGFRITFHSAVDRQAAATTSSYLVQSYTRVWGGSYATPDSERQQLKVDRADVDDDGRSVRLTVPGRKLGHVYDITLSGSLAKAESLWPEQAHFTLKRIPEARASDR